VDDTAAAGELLCENQGLLGVDLAVGSGNRVFKTSVHEYRALEHKKEQPAPKNLTHIFIMRHSLSTAPYLLHSRFSIGLLHSFSIFITRLSLYCFTPSTCR